MGSSIEGSRTIENYDFVLANGGTELLQRNFILSELMTTYPTEHLRKLRIKILVFFLMYWQAYFPPDTKGLKLKQLLLYQNDCSAKETIFMTS